MALGQVDRAGVRWNRFLDGAVLQGRDAALALGQGALTSTTSTHGVAFRQPVPLHNRIQHYPRNIRMIPSLAYVSGEVNAPNRFSLYKAWLCFLLYVHCISWYVQCLIHCTSINLTVSIAFINKTMICLKTLT